MLYEWYDINKRQRLRNETKHTHKKEWKETELATKQVRKYEYISHFVVVYILILTTVIVIHSVMIIIMAFFYAYFRSFIFMVFGKLQKALAGTFQNLFSPGKPHANKIQLTD